MQKRWSNGRNSKSGASGQAYVRLNHCVDFSPQIPKFPSHNYDFLSVRPPVVSGPEGRLSDVRFGSCGAPGAAKTIPQNFVSPLFSEILLENILVETWICRNESFLEGFQALVGVPPPPLSVCRHQHGLGISGLKIPSGNFLMDILRRFLR